MRLSRHVFVTGGTGYMGRRVIAALLSRGHRVRALVREGSQGMLRLARKARRRSGRPD